MSLWDASGFLMVGQAGVEPATPGLGILCSVQLSYWPSKKLRLDSTKR
jgi:hypothetical protein